MNATRHLTCFLAGSLLFWCVKLVAAEEKQAVHTFENIGWSIRDDFGYQVRILNGKDGNLLGVTLRIWNTSPIQPLVMTTAHNDRRLNVLTSVEDGPLVTQSARDTERGRKSISSKPVEWTIPPAAVEDYFLPVRDLMPKNFVPHGAKECRLLILLSVGPKGFPLDLHSQKPLPVVPVTVTDESMKADAEAIFREAIAAEKRKK